MVSQVFSISRQGGGFNHFNHQARAYPPTSDNSETRKWVRHKHSMCKCLYICLCIIVCVHAWVIVYMRAWVYVIQQPRFQELSTLWLLATPKWWKTDLFWSNAPPRVNTPTDINIQMPFINFAHSQPALTHTRRHDRRTEKRKQSFKLCIFLSLERLLTKL